MSSESADPTMLSYDVPEGAAVLQTKELAEWAATAGPGVRTVSGAAGCTAALLVQRLLHTTPNRRVVALTSSQEAARTLASDLRFLLTRDVLILPASESSPYAEVNPDRPAAQLRLATLFRIAMDLPWQVLVMPLAAWARRVVPRDEVVDHSELLIQGQELDRDALLRRLTQCGYARSPLCEDPGTFAVRGALVDVWSPSSTSPLRVEMDGDLITTIKHFDPDDQRTLREVRDAWLTPAREAVLTPARAERASARVRTLCDAVDLPTSRTRALIDDVTSGRAFHGSDSFLPAYVDLEPFGDYLPNDVTIVVEDPAAAVRALRDELGRGLADAAAKGAEPHFDSDAFYVSESEVAETLFARPSIALCRTATVGDAGDELPLDRLARASLDATPTLHAFDQADLQRAIKTARSSKGRAATLTPLIRRIARWREMGLRILLTARAQTQVERLTSLLSHRDVSVTSSPDAFRPESLLEEAPDALRPGEVRVALGPLARGVVAPAEGLAIVTEEEIFGARAHRRAARAADSKKPARSFLQDLRSLTVGDLVVHVEHGIGRYLGLSHRDVGGIHIDLLTVEYASGDKLHLPVYRLNQVQKYSGGEATPKLDRLGGQTFARTKTRAKKHLRNLADELLRLYAERKASVAEPVPPADDEYRAFEATFPFDETPDQSRAIADVERDLENGQPMDRIVCGDVGFGKTEVALRAAFRVATSGRQVALLCPTTVLAQQHLLTFQSRIDEYALIAKPMSRFQSKSDQAETRRGLKNGTVDIVIGTHRLLSKDIHFKRLGLLIVDEEQRFGVSHKERIKQLKANVDVLTLSATPIPRTLQMAVSGLRDMSIINTPPIDRRAIRTIVTRHDESVLREAVRRELARGGQVFYVYNRIEGLYERAARLAELVPEARICVGHGQMNEASLERTMLDFVDGRYDILCSTAIVESGLDIPRANTILIDRADTYGLAQLYQLRGRVGRSRERAYCYLIVPPEDSMTEEARTRIEAMERHTDLGSGFQIAALDLELRGAGDLLGAEQSGTVASVGFDLFCQMLDEAVHELRGEPVVHDVDPELSFDCEALLPDDYVQDVGVRLSLYKRLASAASPDEVAELAVEMEDRFGPPPVEARRLAHLMRLKTELRRLRVLGCEATAKSVTMHLNDDTPLDPTKILELVTRRPKVYRLTPDMRLTRRTKEGEPFESGLDATDKLLAELSPCLADQAS